MWVYFTFFFFISNENPLSVLLPCVKESSMLNKANYLGNDVAKGVLICSLRLGSI